MALSVFDWAKYRCAKGAVKIHLLLDHDGYLPTYAKLTDGKTHEVNIAHELKLVSGSIVAMDRGYLDFKLLEKWDNDGIYFVTRTKVNTVYTVVKDNPLPETREHVLEDKIIRLSNGQEYRLVTVFDEVNEMYLELLTNIRKFAAATIGDIYRDRWQIEVFFRYLKQNLKIKTFVGTSPNAVLIQVWTALTAMLMLAYMRFKSKFGWSLSNLVAMFRWNVFAHKELWSWLDNPFALPPPEPENYQPNLPGFNFGQQVV
jgi:IS4 transposase